MNESSIAKLKAQAEKLLGKGIITSGKDLIDKPKTVISVSPAIDIGLGGGIPEGVTVIFSGMPKFGKTTSALCFARNAQRLNRPVFYFDVEHRLKEMNLTGIKDLVINEPLFYHIHSIQDKILTAEETLTLIELTIKTVPNAVIIIDSSSALCAEKEMVGDISASTRNDGPKLMASFCRKNAASISVNNCTLIIIQHLIANTSGYGSPYQEDGGMKVKFQQDVKMRIKKSEAWSVGDKQVGQIQTWNIMTNALGASPSEVTSYVRYGTGIDETMEWVSMGIDLGIIDKGGAWFCYNNTKYHGQENLYQHFVEDKNELDKLVAEIKGIIG